MRYMNNASLCVGMAHNIYYIAIVTAPAGAHDAKAYPVSPATSSGGGCGHTDVCVIRGTRRLLGRVLLLP